MQTHKTHCCGSDAERAGSQHHESDYKYHMTEMPVFGSEDACAGREIVPSRHVGYACHRDLFTQELYNRYASAFWMLPRSWGEDGGPNSYRKLPFKGIEKECALAFFRRTGGSGLISIMPVLGWIAALDKDEWALSAEELSRLCNVDKESIRRARQALNAMFPSAGSGIAYVDQRHGKRLLHWSIPWYFAAMEEDRGQGIEREPYFFFSHRLIHGGQWAMLSAVQRAVYLAVATFARAHHESVDPLDDPLVSGVVVPGTGLDDMRRSQAAYVDQPTLRLACTSYSEIASVSGYSPSAVKVAVRSFKHPAMWPRSTNDTRVLEYSPLWVYPTVARGALLYHFRDHVRPWPWDLLNASDRDSLTHSEIAQRLVAGGR